MTRGCSPSLVLGARASGSWGWRVAGAGALVVHGFACADGRRSPAGTSTGTSVNSPGGTGGQGASGATSTGGTGLGGASGGGGGGDPFDCSSPTGEVGQPSLIPLATGLDFPVLATTPPQQPERVFVLERQGRVLLVQGGSVSTFLDVTAQVESSAVLTDERGLLGLAFHPSFEESGRFFVHYVRKGDWANTVVEYRVSDGDPDVASTTPVGVVVTVPPVAGSHNGGSIEFGPDGYLHVALGDGGLDYDPNGHGQDPTTLRAAVLRMDVDQRPYAPAPGNVPGGAPEVFHFGLRNPYRMAFDACTGDLYIGDVGAAEWEEINIAPAGSGSHNFGWVVTEGAECVVSGCDTTAFTLPAQPYSHAEGCAVVGGQVYRGSALPALRGAYLYADFCYGFIRWLRWTTGGVEETGDLTDVLASSGKFISAIGRDAAGELLVVELGAELGLGAVYRVFDPQRQ